MLQRSDLKVLFGQRSLTNRQNVFRASLHPSSAEASGSLFSHLFSLSLLFCMQIDLTQLPEQTYPNKLKFSHHKTQVYKFMRPSSVH